MGEQDTEDSILLLKRENWVKNWYENFYTFSLFVYLGVWVFSFYLESGSQDILIDDTILARTFLL